jgi:stage II sporulation protein D
MFVGVPLGPDADRFASAARSTRGVVLLVDSRVFPAYYHSTCGGATVGAVEVFGGPGLPALAGVPCGSCEHAPRRRWEVRVPAASLAAAGIGRPRRITVTSRTPSGRAERLGLEGGETTSVGAADLRSRLPSPALPSTWIESVSPVRGGFLFRGRGYGHGVGLCQYGAAGRAARGWSAEDILRDYYPGASVSRLY